MVFCQCYVCTVSVAGVLCLYYISGGSCHKYPFCHNKSFVATNMCLLRQTCVCRNKTLLSLQQKYACCDKTFVMTNTCLSWQIFVTTKIFCRGKHTFVVTKDVFCHDKHISVTTKLVATKILLVAAPRNGSTVLCFLWVLILNSKLLMHCQSSPVWWNWPSCLCLYSYETKLSNSWQSLLAQKQIADQVICKRATTENRWEQPLKCLSQSVADKTLPAKRQCGVHVTLFSTDNTNSHRRAPCARAMNWVSTWQWHLTLQLSFFFYCRLADHNHQVNYFVIVESLHSVCGGVSAWGGGGGEGACLCVWIVCVCVCVCVYVDCAHI